MRHKSDALKEKIYQFVNDWKRDKGHSPSLGDIAKRLDVSRTTIYRYLTEMTEEGSLHYDGRIIDTPEYNRENMRFSLTKLVGEVPCGETQEKEEHVEDYINLPVSLFGSGSFYALRASGDSMEDAGISEGDIVIIAQQQEAKKGEIVVALDDEGKNTLKRYGGQNEAGNHILAYQNEAVYPNKTILVREFVVQGVARHVIKTLR